MSVTQSHTATATVTVPPTPTPEEVASIVDDLAVERNLKEMELELAPPPKPTAASPTPSSDGDELELDLLGLSTPTDDGSLRLPEPSRQELTTGSLRPTAPKAREPATGTVSEQAGAKRPRTASSPGSSTPKPSPPAAPKKPAAPTPKARTPAQQQQQEREEEEMAKLRAKVEALERQNAALRKARKAAPTGAGSTGGGGDHPNDACALTSEERVALWEGIRKRLAARHAAFKDYRDAPHDSDDESEEAEEGGSSSSGRSRKGRGGAFSSSVRRKSAHTKANLFVGDRALIAGELAKALRAATEPRREPGRASDEDAESLDMTSTVGRHCRRALFWERVGRLYDATFNKQGSLPPATRPPGRTHDVHARDLAKFTDPAMARVVLVPLAETRERAATRRTQRREAEARRRSSSGPTPTPKPTKGSTKSVGATTREGAGSRKRPRREVEEEEDGGEEEVRSGPSRPTSEGEEGEDEFYSTSDSEGEEPRGRQPPQATPAKARPPTGAGALAAKAPKRARRGPTPEDREAREGEGGEEVEDISSEEEEEEEERPAPKAPTPAPTRPPGGGVFRSPAPRAPTPTTTKAPTRRNRYTQPRPTQRRSD